MIALGPFFFLDVCLDDDGEGTEAGDTNMTEDTSNSKDLRA